MKKNLRFTALILVLALMPLAGCVGQKNKPIRVAVFTTDPNIIKILNKATLDVGKKLGIPVRLESVPYGNYLEKITTQMAAGDPPDIISVEASQFPDLYLRNALEDLSDLAAKDQVDLKAYYAAIVGRFSPGGRLHAMPGDIAPLGVLYYNKKIFDEAGVPYPSRKWSWPEPFLTYCRKLVKKDAGGKTTRWAYTDPYAVSAEAFLLSNGGYFTDSEHNPTRLTLDSPQALEAFRFRQDMIYAYHVAPTPSEMQTFSAGSAAEKMFAHGLAAMMCSGIWHVPTFLQEKDLEFDIAEFPAGPGGLRAWGSGGSGFAMAKGCKKREQAWQVIKELTGKEILTQIAATGMAQPAMIEVAKSDAFLKTPGPANKRILLDMPNNARFGPFVNNWGEIWYGQVGPAADKIWLGTKKPGEVLPELVRQVNRNYFSKK